jgi:hypothetical protein
VSPTHFLLSGPKIIVRMILFFTFNLFSLTTVCPCKLQPDRPDELLRIQEAGGRVIYWDGPRVLGVLAMSRAIGN